MFAAGFLFLIAAANDGASSQALVCPAELPASAISVTQAPAGWTGFVPTALPLNDVGLSTGALEDRATLLGQHHKLPRGAFAVDYSDLREWQGRDRWLLCKYGEGNSVSIARRLPSAINQCTVTFTPDKFGGKTIAITCR